MPETTEQAVGDGSAMPAETLMQSAAKAVLLLAGRHLDPTEGVMQVGHVVTDSDIAALRTVLNAVSALLRE